MGIQMRECDLGLRGRRWDARESFRGEVGGGGVDASQVISKRKDGYLYLSICLCLYFCLCLSHLHLPLNCVEERARLGSQWRYTREVRGRVWAVASAGRFMFHSFVALLGASLCVILGWLSSCSRT